MKTRYGVVVAGMFLLLSMILIGGDKPIVKLAGLQVVGPGYGLNGTELQPFHQQSGTALALVIQAPENREIVELDDSKCTLVEFTDDRDHDLLDGVSWGAFPKISEDHRIALIEVTSKNRPSQKASRIRAKGNIQLRLAASESTETIENLKLEVGTKASVGQEIVQVMKVEEEDDGLTLVLQINRKLVDNLKDIRFYTGKGNPIEIWGRGSFTFGNVSQVEYNLDTKLTSDNLNIEIDLWQEPEVLNLSFEIESGLGLQG
jgi:hypothetical protein